MNYFELFGFEEKPFADRSLVTKKYFELQKKYHPDFFTNESESDKEDALEQSAHVNKAFNIFKDPEKTIEYFLKQKGVLAENEKYNLPPAFLMEMMEMNEELEGKEEAEVQQQVASYESSLRSQVESILQPDAKITDEDLQKLKLFYYKKKYLDRILDRLDD